MCIGVTSERGPVDEGLNGVRPPPRSTGGTLRAFAAESYLGMPGTERVNVPVGNFVERDLGGVESS
jgi:hypothetical protein